MDNAKTISAYVKAQTGLGRSTIYQQIKDGEFPQQIRLGKRAVCWLDAEVEAWVNRRVELSRGC